MRPVFKVWGNKYNRLIIEGGGGGRDSFCLHDNDCNVNEITLFKNKGNPVAAQLMFSVHFFTLRPAFYSLLERVSKCAPLYSIFAVIGAVTPRYGHKGILLAVPGSFAVTVSRFFHILQTPLPFMFSSEFRFVRS